jgi:hypothetical protein
MPKRTPKKHQAIELTAQLRLDIKPDTLSYYVNYIAVSHTAYDFTLSAAKMPSPLSQEQLELAKSGQQVPLETVVQLVIPPLIVDGLMKALADQKAKHEKTLAQQVKNNEIQHNVKQSDSVH